MRYRGGIGQWSWMLHRLTGVGVLIFLCLHILDTALIVLGPEHYNTIIQLYRHPLFRVMEVGLFAAVLYHALNGVRIMLIDFWGETFARAHKTLVCLELVIFVTTIIPVTYLMLRHVF